MEAFWVLMKRQKNRSHLRWARICVKNSDTSFPVIVELIAEKLIFKVPLWVESISWVEEIGWKSEREGDRKREDDHQRVSQNSKSRINERQSAPSSSKTTKVQQTETH